MCVVLHVVNLPPPTTWRDGGLRVVLLKPLGSHMQEVAHRIACARKRLHSLRRDGAAQPCGLLPTT